MPRELLRLLHQIPVGCVTTYGDLARALGDVRAARWVGESLLDHEHADGCGCHRVVRVDGDLGLYITRRSDEKAAQLCRDGVTVRDARVDLDQYGFRDFRCDAPLATLRELQERIPDELILKPLSQLPRLVGGVDVSYVNRTTAVASFVLLDASTQELLWTTSYTAAVTFPYITGYLSFRELTILSKLFQQVREAGREPDVTFVDGNGILHPRRAGSAACFGLEAGTPTIGVGKKLLCGKLIEDDGTEPGVANVVHNDRCVGYAVRAGKSNRPFYVSPGHLTDLSSTLTVTKRMLGDRRLPLPIVLADRVSRKEAKRLKVESEEPAEPVAG